MEGQTMTPPILVAEDLVAGYFEDIHILQGISVQAWPGRITCVLGPNGTGKSTLLKTLFGFLRPVQGRVIYQGEDITGLPPYEMPNRGIAYLPQRPSIFPFLSVEVNLRLGAWHERRDRRQVREKIEELYRRFPLLWEKRYQPAGQLSGGQQRQLEIARSLMTDPVLYLIDEPTAGIDPQTSEAIYRMIHQLAREQGKAILLVDQNIKKALEIADYIYVVRVGTLFAEGPREAFGRDTEALVARWLYASGEP
ncbi:MAG: ABC transporter ATP-binding protein [Nitrospinota bacterium]|nr:MAG: ABC transporter ATP-binding protein [Nitrospinota bacterium]